MQKNIVCFGDSNTHGYCAQDGGRFDEKTRWPKLLQAALGEGYNVVEEGLSGRTTCFEDPCHEGLSGISSLYPILMSHEPVDLLLLMLGTNDLKSRFAAAPENITAALERLVQKAKSVECWRNAPAILIIAPTPILPDYWDTEIGPAMGPGCWEKSLALAPLYEALARRRGCSFLDAAFASMNTVDYMHLDAAGHRALALRLAQLVPTLVG